MEELNIEVARLIQKVSALEELVKSKPESIISANIMSSVIDRFDVTASQASDIIHLMQTGELKSDKDIEKYLKSQKNQKDEVKNNSKKEVTTK